jgi:drug/metabolite transporter (DMT)-like permease
MSLTSLPSGRGSAGLLGLQMTVFCLLWSFAFVAGKIAITDCPPLMLLTARFLAAGLLVLLIPAMRGGLRGLTLRAAGVFALIGVANNALYLGLGYTALRSVSVGLSTLIISANPIVTAVLAALFLGESLTARKVLGLLLGIAGVAIIVAHRLSAGTDSALGILLNFGALASLVAGTFLFKRFAPAHHLWIGNGIQNLAAALVLAPVALATSSLGDISWTPRLLWAFVYLVLPSSILALWLWLHLLKVCGATVASSLHFLIPPLGMLFAHWVLHEHVVALDLLGVVPVALGIYLVTRPEPVPGGDAAPAAAS